MEFTLFIGIVRVSIIFRRRILFNFMANDFWIQRQMLMEDCRILKLWADWTSKFIGIFWWRASTCQEAAITWLYFRSLQIWDLRRDAKKTKFFADLGLGCFGFVAKVWTFLLLFGFHCFGYFFLVFNHSKLLELFLCFNHVWTHLSGHLRVEIGV